jgi:isocitrate dehydrogenase
VYQTLKLITQPGSEKIIRYAFEYARANGRKKVTVMVKDNIMKITDGLFHDLFKQIATEYPEIEHESYIIDIGAARLAEKPERFDVIVTLNLYGDIISDIAAEVSGSVGFGPSANIGDKAAMFEAIHGSAPDIAGKDIANPSGLLLSAVMLLLHLGKNKVAERIHNAWLRTIEDGIATGDIYTEGQSRERVGTQAFADAVIARLGQSPERLECIVYPERASVPTITPRLGSKAVKTTVGADIFLDWEGEPNGVEAIAALSVPGLKLLAASNRGLRVWPGYTAQEVFVDHWRLRYVAAEKGQPVSHQQLLDQQRALVAAGYDVIKTENLCDFDGKPGYSLMQGQ